MAAKQTKNLPALDDEAMRELARRYKDTVAGVAMGQFVSFRGGQMSVDGIAVKDNRLEIVVLDFVLENSFYPEWDPNNTQPPLCYAFGHKVEGMAPHEQALDKQHPACEGCPQNEFGTADKGRGKACKNGMRLAVLAADGLDAGTAGSAELRFVKLPVTSVRGFATFVKQVGEVLKKAPFMVVAEMQEAIDAKTQYKVAFKVVDEIKDRALLAALYARHQVVAKQIMFPYPAPEEKAPAKDPRKPMTGGKKGAPARRGF